MLSSLAVNGRNVALLDRTSPKYKTNKPNPIIFIDGKTFYQNKVTPESCLVQNKPKKYYKKRVKLRKVTFPRSCINIPVQSLPEPLLLGADTGEGSTHHGCPKCQPDSPEHRLTPCQNNRRANVSCGREATSKESARSNNHPVSVRRHWNSHHLENKTLIQIREARKVTDFKRILSSNAILCGAVRSQASAQLSEMLSDATVNTSFSVNRPQSAFSVWSVNNTYNFLFQSHLDSLQSVVNHRVSEKTSDKFYSKYRDGSENRVSVSEPRIFEELYNIPEYYQQTDLIFPVSKKVLPKKLLCNKESPATSNDSEPAIGCLNNFNVNLSDLISAGNKSDNTSINTSGEVINCDSRLGNISGKGEETTISMSTTQQQGTLSHCLNNKRDCLAEIDRSLCELDINININKVDVPQITLSECREIPSHSTNLQPGQSFNLSVPSVECCVESRPPPTD